jgi:DMSO reductase anchor subunit
MTVELLPPRPQALWGVPAVANFTLGGLGTGLYAVAALAAGLGPSPAVATAAWLGPALVLGGFAAVASESGRPFRGARVLARLRSSWMSRELWVGGGFVLLAAAGELAGGAPWQRGLAVLAALATAASQGFILRRARGVAAWDRPLMPLVFLLSALVSGGGLLVLTELAAGRRPGHALLRALLLLLALDAIAWGVLVAPGRDEAVTRATRPLREAPALAAVLGGGHLLPLLLVAIAVALSTGAELLAPGAVLAIGGQVCAKAALILMAGQLRPITIPRLGAHVRPS